MAEVGTITVRLVYEAREDEWRRELERVNGDLSQAQDELAELRARDHNTYAREVVAQQLREAEELARTEHRRALDAEHKVHRIERIIQGRA